MNIEEYNELFDSVKFYESSEIIQNKIIELEKENINLKSILQKKRKEKVELKFSDYLKSVIKERNKKLVKIHQETGISTSYLTDILKGRNLPSKEKLELLIKNLNLDSKESQRLKLYWIDSKNPFEEIVFRDDEFDKEKILNEIINFFSNENISIKEKEKTFYLIQNSFFKGKYSNKKNNNF
ncbi:helix-turn-helix domain-containing protein [Fusobacterium ulcerans]|nr:helix-turn-helix transcriptional regulator [Fusobacterium ulcerans]